MRIEQAVKQTAKWIASHALFPRGSKGIVAFSGGPDSLFLLLVLRQLRQEWDLTLHAVHVDHGLRKESGEEALRAQSMARKLGVDAVMTVVDNLSKEYGNIQERARLARHSLLTNEATKRGAQWIALGHTADDQAETVVMRLLRGSGTRGFGAMSPRAENRQTTLVRPVLWATRDDIEKCLSEQGIEPLRDPTNEKPDYLRNRVRHLHLPAMAVENPSIHETLCRISEICREENDALEQVANGVFLRARSTDGLAIRVLHKQPRAIVNRVLMRSFAEVSGGLRGLSRSHLNMLCALMESTDGAASVHLPGVHVQRNYAHLLFTRNTHRRDPLQQSPGVTLVISESGTWGFGDMWQIGIRPVVAESPENDTLCQEKLRFPITIRTWRSGDRIAIGNGKHKKVSRVLMEAKIPASERGHLPLVVQDEKIVLIPGIRRAAGWQVRHGGRGWRFELTSCRRQLIIE